jgi:hypothetical protein
MPDPKQNFRNVAFIGPRVNGELWWELLAKLSGGDCNESDRLWT